MVSSYPAFRLVWRFFLGRACGGEDCSDMAEFGHAKADFLKQFLRLRHGIPSHDTFSRLFRRLDRKPFHAGFLRFMERFAAGLEGVSAIDGKSLRRPEPCKNRQQKQRIICLACRLPHSAAPTSSAPVGGSRMACTGSSTSSGTKIEPAIARTMPSAGRENIALLRRLALNLAKLEGSKGSMKGKLKRAGWNNTFFATLLAQFNKFHMR